QLPFQAFRSGTFGLVGDAERRRINRRFEASIAWLDHDRALRLHLQPHHIPKTLTPDTPDLVHYHPADIFLADLSGGPAREWYLDKMNFVGKGGAEKPFGIGKSGDSRPTHTASAARMPYCLVLRRQVTIPAQESVRLRFAYGTVEPGKTADSPS